MTSQASALFRRTSFTGRTDKFAPTLVPNGHLGDDLNRALKKIAPVDVAGSLLTDPYVRDATSRLSNYNRYVDYFAGRHHKIEYDGGDRKVTFNFPRKIVNKRAAWVAGRDGFRFLPQRGNELVTDTLDNVWRSNSKKRLVRKTAKIALTTGDAYWYTTVKTKDRNGKDLPRDEWYIRILPLNPSFVFPVWSEDDPNVMRACLIQFPIWNHPENKESVFTAYYTHDKVKFYENYVLTNEAENVLGIIPIAHVACDAYGDMPFGTSALVDVIPVQDKFNEVILQLGKIVKYHSDPTTIVYGASLAQFEKAANKVWSNLPAPDMARVENLELRSDLAAAYKLQEIYKDEIYEHGKTPQIVYDSKGLAVSNTSGVALQLLFQPLVEATIELQDEFDVAIRHTNAVIAAIYERIFGIDLQKESDAPERFLETEVQWLSLLPKDEQAEMDLIAKKLELGLISKAEASRRVSGVSDTQRLALELASDSMAQLAIDSQKAIALQGHCPRLESAFLGSIFLSEDLVDIATEIGDLSADEGTGTANSGSSSVP